MREERAFHQFAVLDWRQALPLPGSHTINKSAAEFGPGGATPDQGDYPEAQELKSTLERPEVDKGLVCFRLSDL
jgi:hypothetical protein